jgi:hypothetical protein
MDERWGVWYKRDVSSSTPTDRLWGPTSSLGLTIECWGFYFLKYIVWMRKYSRDLQSLTCVFKITSCKWPSTLVIMSYFQFNWQTRFDLAVFSATWIVAFDHRHLYNGQVQEIKNHTGSRDSSVCVASGYGLDCQGSIPGRDKRFFSTPQRPDRLWDPRSLVYNGYRGLFPRLKTAGAWSWPLISI